MLKIRENLSTANLNPKLTGSNTSQVKFILPNTIRTVRRKESVKRPRGHLRLLHL